MTKRELKQRRTEQIDYLLFRINSEFLKEKPIRLDFEDGHWLHIYELHDPIEYCLKLDDNRVKWLKYKELNEQLLVFLANKGNKIYDEDGNNLETY